jgi:copper chaperone
MTRLSIPDMSCGHCKAAVEAALSGVPGAQPVAVDLARREAVIGGAAPTEALLAALAAAGYPAQVTTA